MGVSGDGEGAVRADGAEVQRRRLRPAGQRGAVGLAAADDPLLAGEGQPVPGVQQHPDAPDDRVRAAVHPRVRAGGVRDEDLRVVLGRVRVAGAVDLAHQVAAGPGTVGRAPRPVEAAHHPADLRRAGRALLQHAQCVHGHQGVVGADLHPQVAVAARAVEGVGGERRHLHQGVRHAVGQSRLAEEGAAEAERHGQRGRAGVQRDLVVAGGRTSRRHRLGGGRPAAEQRRRPAASGTAEIRWMMSGFNRARGATDRPRTGRNLMGQIDGTGNPDPSEYDAKIFVADATGPHAWMNGGSYAVVRRIRMLLDTWDRLPLARQERIIGRRKSDGAPLSGGTETTPLNLGAVGPDGALAIAGDAHVRVAAPSSNGGATMLRRSFSYHDGLRPDGAPDAGLLFVAWQADPTTGFIQVQRKLDGADGLTRFLRHESSAV
ncbi:Dyp-type peroxidase, partial [Actinomadura bangladeshensis]|nr:Dyp-type peroxidase [Actinomadura bangladeshensis]